VPNVTDVDATADEFGVGEPGPSSTPCPLWCWSLITRSDDDRQTIAALREHASNLAQTTVPVGAIWLPSSDPHRIEIASRPA
jgi:hypothetical protein